MPLDVNIDDNNTTLILYQGTWTYRPGSTRQWESGVHATGEAGASATFNFRGFQLWVMGTLPAGAGTNVITVSIDGDTSSNLSHTSNGTAAYDYIYFTSPPLRDTFHTVIVTNRGSVSSGNSEFMFDRFDFRTEDQVPSFSTFPSATSVSSSSSSSSSSSNSGSGSSTSRSTGSTSTSQSTGSTGTRSTPTTSIISGNTPSPSPSPSTGSSSKSTIPWAGIIGAIVSCFLIVILALLFILWRRRRSSYNAKRSAPLSPLTPSPFPPSSNPSTTRHRILPSVLSEKTSNLRSAAYTTNTSTALTLSPSTSPGSSPLPSGSAVAFLVDPYASLHLNETYGGPPPSYQQKSGP